MSETPSQPEQEPEIQETEKQEYNFELMNDLEVAMTSLVTQLKDKIEQGDYGVLLGDDAKGRIPTLVLGKILKERGPEPKETDDDIKIYFLAAGRLFQEAEEIQRARDYIKKLNFGHKKVLIITEFVSDGFTLKNIARTFKKSMNEFDYAVVFTSHDRLDDYLKDERFPNPLPSDSQIFVGKLGDEPDIVLKGLKKMSGVKTKRPYSPVSGLDQENRENIEKSREDSTLMAQRIIKQVWPEENK